MTYEEAVAFKDEVEALRLRIYGEGLVVEYDFHHGASLHWCNLCDCQVEEGHDCIGGIVDEHLLAEMRTYVAHLGPTGEDSPEQEKTT